jgi:hypothetical protein
MSCAAREVPLVAEGVAVTEQGAGMSIWRVVVWEESDDSRDLYARRDVQIVTATSEERARRAVQVALELRRTEDPLMPAVRLGDVAFLGPA